MDLDEPRARKASFGTKGTTHTDMHFRTSVTKGKREIRGHLSHVELCFLSGEAEWEYLKVDVTEQLKRVRELKMFRKSLRNLLSNH